MSKVDNLRKDKLFDEEDFAVECEVAVGVFRKNDSHFVGGG